MNKNEGQLGTLAAFYKGSLVYLQASTCSASQLHATLTPSSGDPITLSIRTHTLTCARAHTHMRERDREESKRDTLIRK